MQAAGVRFVLNLADTDEKILGYMAKDDFNSPGFAALYKKDCVDPIALNMNFGSEEFRGRTAPALCACCWKRFAARDTGRYGTTI